MFHYARIAAVACWVAACALPASAQLPEPAGPQSSGPEAEDSALGVTPAEMAPSKEEIAAAMAEFDASLERRTGTIPVPGASITLTLPEAFYFLNTDDARKVLEGAWGNPPDEKVAGMIFPAGMSAIEEGAWGVVLTFEATGYVSDEDATSIDYDMLIDAMREGLDQENAARREQGYPGLDIIGWATQPRYDAKTHKLLWAKEIAFDGEPENTLNYDMRVLGRHGVLSLNFVASVNQLAEIEAAGPAVLAIPEFDAGARYEDFNASTDPKADFGVAGLIGGAAAAAALAKNGGILAAILLFLKKGWFIVAAAIAGIGALAGRVLNRTPKAEERREQRAATAFFDQPAETTDEPKEPPPPSSSGV